MSEPRPTTTATATASVASYGTIVLLAPHSLAAAERIGEWNPITSREQAGALDAWTEYLCLGASAAGPMLSICGEQLLGEVPAECSGRIASRCPST